MENRRQSGLWAQNAETGFYEQKPPPNQPGSGPFQYYEPPTRTSGEKGRSFADRTGEEQPATYRPTQNGGGGVQRSESRKIRDLAEGATQKLHNRDEQTTHTNTSARLGPAQKPLRVDPDFAPDNIRSKPWSPDLISPNSQPNRQRQASTASSNNNNNAAELLRRGSVPDRSPLQKLEMELGGGRSKGEKRARAEEAERRARYHSSSSSSQKGGAGRGLGLGAEGDGVRHGMVRNEKGRVVSEGSGRRAEEGVRREERARRVSEDRPRRVPDEMPAVLGAEESGGSKFRRATEALRQETTPVGGEIAGDRRRAPQVKSQPAYPAPQRDGASRPEQPASTNSAALHGHSAIRRDAAPSQEQPTSIQEKPISMDGAADLPARSNSKYRRRARDAGFVGAAAAMAGGIEGKESAADRGRAAHERRKSQLRESPQASPISPSSKQEGFLGRSNSKKLQKRSGPPTERNSTNEEGYRNGNLPREEAPAKPAQATKQALQTDRMGGGGKKDIKAAVAKQDPDPLPREQVALASQDPLNYRIPPQTAAALDAREQLGFGAETSPVHSQLREKHHKFGGMFHRNGEEQRSVQPEGKMLDEWRNAGTAKLIVEDLEYDEQPRAAVDGTSSAEMDAVWWEKNGRRTSSGGSRQAPPQYDGPYEEEAKHFRPPLYLKCGPLLRFTGIRKEAPVQQSRSTRSAGGEKEVWHGSIMIVTDDRQSDYATVPTLRLFDQPMDLHTPPPQHLLESGQELPPEYEDPVAGQVKLSRTGRPLYVRHVHEIDGEVDLSREENPQGLFAATRTPMLGPQSVSGPDGRQSQHITFQDKSRVKRNVAEKGGQYREIPAARLHVERGYTFWRFNVAIELGARQHRIAYRINRGPAIGFWVPARGETMNIMFHSCNGFSLAVDPHHFSGPDPLWRDVLNQHQVRPFHVMLGGGDQIYNDAAMRDTTLFAEWLRLKNPEHKHSAEFTVEMQEELETFYLDRYAMWFSQGLFGMANSQIPMVNVWDDHDIIDGFGSYPHHFMSSPVFAGLGAMAFKYYMLFQHQTVPAETTREEESWVLGASLGPYIAQRSRSVFMFLGTNVAFLGLDCRTERMRDEILSQGTYDAVFDRCRGEIVRGQTKHLIVLLGVPIAYPRLNFLENILTSRVMDPIKAIGRTGLLGGFVNKFDGGVEILDDLDDHWTAKHHKAERNWFVQELQELAAEKSVRVTILGGDVHLGAVGQFHTPRKFGVGKDRDHRYMPNIVSSAIVNTPPPVMMADVLNRRNKVHHLDRETDEDMIPMFEADVDGSKRNNRCLLPRRNYCTIREFAPGATPPGSPGVGGDGQGMFSPGERDAMRGEKRFPPGSMKRTMSLTRGPASLVRRLSGSAGRNKTSSASAEAAPGMQRANSLGGGSTHAGSYFPDNNPATPPQRPTNQFHRRPTSLSVKEARKAAAKGGPGPGPDGTPDEGREAGHIDLQGGLDISLNMEIDQRDPGGATVGYRLLVPALWYEGEGDENTSGLKGRGGGLMGKLRGHGQRHDGVDDGEYGEGEREGMRPPGSRGQQVVRSSGGAMAAAVAGGGGGHHGQDGAYDDRGFGVAGATAGQHGTDSVPNEGRPGQEAFRTRRPSFMDRFRGRGKRDVEDDDYSSRSGSPSPPPSRGQQRMRGPAGAAVTGQYNAEDVHGDQRAGGTESRPGQEAFRTRRPSFIDRLRGRGKRDLDDDDYSSRSGSPSPPPGRGQQQMRGSAGAAAAGQFDAEGAHGDPRIVGNESRPGQEAFRARRPSLMDRLRGRGKRELDEDDYSSQSGSPSPPPGRGQPDHMGGSEPAAMAGAQREPYAYANDRMEEGDRLPFKARRPSLMDRLRGRSKRGEVGEDGYSRSPTPSPPPSSRRQQQQLPQHIRGPADAAMGGGAQRAAYQQPQTQAGRRIASDMQYVPPTQAARNKGYNLASPPVGSAPQPVARAGPGAAAAGGNNNPYPQSGIRHSSAPLSKPLQMQPGRQQPLANEPWRHDEQMSEGSFTGSDEYVDEKEVEGRRRQSTQVRRASKAERFFGIGDEGGSWGGNGNGGGRAGKVRDEREEFEDGDEAGAGMGKKKAGWKVWK
ncbi:hypothetical protein B0A55_01713 [Friedmanniomyces simplex]|uniref:PhoD-like phosphatase domain-containing protein n=1 Tax=Friedmanniomyces simplex TaxID=329884 RepID=A0A4U0XZ42_9PEZI|nr:hypothetical protein B0A55_01713 [Friedmanniomyces simplex]